MERSFKLLGKFTTKQWEILFLKLEAANFRVPETIRDHGGFENPKVLGICYCKGWSDNQVAFATCNDVDSYGGFVTYQELVTRLDKMIKDELETNNVVHKG